jgi:dCMP deaminase
MKMSWDDYFLNIMHAVALRATCDRGRSACVITRDNRMLVSGYVGSIPGQEECDEVGHLMEKVIHEDGSISEHCHRTIHCEQNAIIQAAKLGVSIDKSTAYVSMTPCRTCAMLLISAGIIRVVCEKKYHQGALSEEMFKKAGVELVFKSEDIKEYSRQKCAKKPKSKK